MRGVFPATGTSGKQARSAPCPFSRSFLFPFLKQTFQGVALLTCSSGGWVPGSTGGPALIPSQPPQAVLAVVQEGMCVSHVRGGGRNAIANGLLAGRAVKRAATGKSAREGKLKTADLCGGSAHPRGGVGSDLKTNCRPHLAAGHQPVGDCWSRLVAGSVFSIPGVGRYDPRHPKNGTAAESVS